MLFWDIIKNEFCLVLQEIFDKCILCESQNKGVLTLLHKSGDRDNIRNWRPLTLLNTDYKIIAKILAESLKKVLPKIIHTDQKGFVKGRIIGDANRMIQDIIDYIDITEGEGMIIFLDQEKAFDRVEWGWVDYVLQNFNFGDKFRLWIKMLLNNSVTCIKTNGFVSKYFPISRSARQGCPIAPLLYIIQAEPLACAIRASKDIKGFQLPGEREGEFIESKLSMFADDSQFFNKNEESVVNCFDILTKYEKASGSKINFQKTKGLLIGNAKRKNHSMIKYRGLRIVLKR